MASIFSRGGNARGTTVVIGRDFSRIRKKMPPPNLSNCLKRLTLVDDVIQLLACADKLCAAYLDKLLGTFYRGRKLVDAQLTTTQARQYLLKLPYSLAVGNILSCLLCHILLFFTPRYYLFEYRVPRLLFFRHLAAKRGITEVTAGKNKADEVGFEPTDGD